MKLALILVVMFPLSQDAPVRIYHPGEQLRYRLTQTEMRGGETLTLSGDTLHRVVRQKDRWVEVVTWTRLGEPGSPDDRLARALPAYRLSLAKSGSLESPRPRASVALMGGVTDLQTFYVAVSPAVGIDRLSAAGDWFRRPEPVIGEFADGATILSGRDCTTTTVRLVSASQTAWIVRTTFEPPAKPCLKRPAAARPPENFEMVRKTGDAFLDLHGRERFSIMSTLERPSGRIKRAEMTNILDLEGRSCAEAALAHCRPLPPIRRERRVELDLIGVTP